jgi:hypothetical protein
MTKITISREEMREHLTKAVRQQIYSEAATITKTQIRDQLMAVTRDQRQKTIQALLGVDTKWGEIQLYQTNGHVTQLQMWAKETLADELEVFVKEAAREAWENEKSKLRENIKTAIYKQVKETCSGYNYRGIITETVSAEVRGIAKEILAEVILDIVPKMEETA